MAGRLVVSVYGHLPRALRLWLVRRGTPKYTLGVLVVLRRADGRILLVQQSYRPGWFLPGGLLQHGESLEAAGRRELREEIRLDAADLVVSRTATPVAHHRWVTWYGFVEVDDERADAITPNGAEVVAVRWCSVDELPGEAQEAYSALVRQPPAVEADAARVR